MHYNDIIGTIGVTIVLIAYFFGMLKWIKQNGLAYYFMNFLGAGLACYASVLIQYFPFIILEGIWSLISLVAFLKLLGKYKLEF